MDLKLLDLVHRNKKKRIEMTTKNINTKTNKMKKTTIYLLSIGTLCMSFTLLTRHFFETPLGIEDFLKGLGVAFIISSLFVQKKLERKFTNS